MFGTPRRSAFLLALPCLGGLAHAAVPTEWTIQLQARSSLNPGVAPFNLPFPSSMSSQTVGVDEEGRVAIRVILGGSAETEGIFVGQGGAGGLVLTGDSEDPVWSSSLDIHNGRLVLADGGFGGGAGVYDTAGVLLQAFPPGGPEGVSGFSSPTLTADGAICYRADFGFTSDKIVIDEFVGGVRGQTLVADTSSGAYTFLFTPRINDARQVVANTIPASGPTRRIVRFEPGGGATTIAETGGAFNAFVNSTGLAHSGEVAFTGRRAAGSVWQVTRSDGLTETPIADGDNADIGNGSLANFPPVVNSAGWVAFRADDVGGTTALWVGDGQDLVKLAEAGQLVETDLGPIALGLDFGGSTGVQVINGGIDINDAGQVAFSAFLANDCVGLFVATPVAACPADCDGSGTLNIDDVECFVAAFSGGGAEADCDGSGTLNIDDVECFTASFAGGCA